MNITPLKNLATKNATDFNVLSNGEAFISQTKVAGLSGIGQDATSKYIPKAGVARYVLL
mgnify:CR=1 FL=1